MFYSTIPVALLFVNYESDVPYVYIKARSLLSCRIFEHFATNWIQVTEFIKLRSTIIFKHFATNQILVTEFIKLRSTIIFKHFATNCIQELSS